MYYLGKKKPQKISHKSYDIQRKSGMAVPKSKSPGHEQIIDPTSKLCSKDKKKRSLKTLEGRVVTRSYENQNFCEYADEFNMHKYIQEYPVNKKAIFLNNKRKSCVEISCNNHTQSQPQTCINNGIIKNCEQLATLQKKQIYLNKNKYHKSINKGDQQISLKKVQKSRTRKRSLEDKLDQIILNKNKESFGKHPPILVLNNDSTQPDKKTVAVGKKTTGLKKQKTGDSQYKGKLIMDNGSPKSVKKGDLGLMNDTSIILSNTRIHDNFMHNIPGLKKSLLKTLDQKKGDNRFKLNISKIQEEGAKHPEEQITDNKTFARKCETERSKAKVVEETEEIEKKIVVGERFSKYMRKFKENLLNNSDNKKGYIKQLNGNHFFKDCILKAKTNRDKDISSNLPGRNSNRIEDNLKKDCVRDFVQNDKSNNNIRHTHLCDISGKYDIDQNLENNKIIRNRRVRNCYFGELVLPKDRQKNDTNAINYHDFVDKKLLSSEINRKVIQKKKKRQFMNRNTSQIPSGLKFDKQCKRESAGNEDDLVEQLDGLKLV